MGTACTIRQEFFCNRRGYSWATYAVQWIWLYLRTSAFWLSCKSFWRKEGGLCFGIADGFRIVSNKPAYKYMADRRDAYGFWKLYHHIDVAANMNGVTVERMTGQHLMSGFHGGYSLGTLIGAGAMSVLFTLGLMPKWAVVICMVFILLALVFKCSYLLSKEEFVSDSPVEKSRKSRLYIPPTVIVVGLLCFIMYASEGAVMGWSAIFVSQERGISMSMAGFFYTAFAVSMTIMRLCGDKIVDQLGQRVVVAGGALLIAVGFMTIVLVDSAVAAAVGFAMVGCGAANVVPQLVSFAVHIKGMAIHNIISFINALGYSGILLGPVIIGFIGKRYGLHVSFIGIAVFALVVAIISYMILRIRHIPIQTDVQEDDRKTCLCNSAK